ncbi:VOC family protein [Anoxybacterium hadale]|uniref:VOC family protein n=1 Tax=Anoxybacterium hadale TaxID=3408580 RepID=A0ACD1A6Q7_9FIRM|nr:VOC family protein [Clostridiales bacterium]
MQKIIPHLWFDTEAAEAAEQYVGLFENSRVISRHILPDTPSGDAEQVEFELAGLKCSAISAGPYFKFNPSISLMVSCKDKEEVDRLYNALCADVLMPLDAYPFSKYYAWIQDRYGLNWQLMLDENWEAHSKIRPVLLFSGEVCGKAEEALDLYVSIFPESEKVFVNRYRDGEAHDKRAKINYSEVNLGGIQLVAMDHGYGAEFTFNEAFSLMVLCQDQKEIDEYWGKLSYVSEAEQCGWIKDRFGLSWQITPANMNELIYGGTEEDLKRLTEAFLKMKKFDLAELERVRNQG